MWINIELEIIFPSLKVIIKFQDTFYPWHEKQIL